MRRYWEEHQWRKRTSGLLLTLRYESVGSKQAASYLTAWSLFGSWANPARSLLLGRSPKSPKILFVPADLAVVKGNDNANAYPGKGGIMPVISRYTKSQGSLGSPRQFRQMSSSRQKRPFVRAAFSRQWASAASKWQYGDAIGARNNAFNLTEPYGNFSDFTNSVRATAYSRLMGKALPQAAMLVNMVQGVQTWEMIASRTMQLVRAFKNLRRGNLGGFASELLLNPNVVKRRMTRKRAIQDPQGAWLEFTFGWSPFIGDIYNAIDVLQTQFPTLPVRGSATSSEVLTDSNRWGWRRQGVRKVQARLVADMVVTNPNLLLANQLGLLNPAAVAWDIIPFSFVVDWFLPVGKFIKTFNDQAGLKLLGQCTTIKHWVVNNERDGGFWTGENFASGVQRIMGNFVKPGFPTKLKLPTGSLWLAATSVALATQVFGGKK